MKLIKLGKEELLTVDNPHYKNLQREFEHLKNAKFFDNDQKAQLPVHIVLASGEYARLKTRTNPLKDYEDLCRLDVLGLADTTEHDQSMVYNEFKEQLTRFRRAGTRPVFHGAEIIHLSHRTKQEASEEVERESAQSTKLRVVYDASAKASPESPSLNECLYAGPSLKNKLWEVLVRAQSFPAAITGEIQNAFLQIRVRESERDSLRFHWRPNSQADVEVLRFTRVLFGSVSFPILLRGVLETHFYHWKSKDPDAVEALRRCLYVDDIISGGCTVDEARKKKLKAIDNLGDATFILRKWASNAKELDEGSVNKNHEEQTAAKQQFRVQPTETKIVGTTWNKEKDTLSVCDLKLPWDAELIGKLKQSWEKWENTLSVLSFQEPCSLEIHGFGDASGEGLCAVVYTVAKPSRVTQELLAAKSRLAKRGMTIPRLELVASDMAANLVSNASIALRHIPHRKQCWSDSTVALYWIKGEGDYKQFVSHRVEKIRAANKIVWHHKPTTDNSADLGSRGGKLTEMWMKGPAWLSERSLWPPDLTIKPSIDSQSEAKAARAIRIGAWVKRFIDNARQNRDNIRHGPLTSEKVEEQHMSWIKMVQAGVAENPKSQTDLIQLNVQPDDDKILRCHGRIQGELPIYLPDDALFTVKLVGNAHLETLHGGVILTMAKILKELQCDVSNHLKELRVNAKEFRPRRQAAVVADALNQKLMEQE
ncbi:uncharacterized protein LOC124452010 [Xenia sp. Carnegie-2017]|uniref:uncharacterized protein LOC124452010 n=1 Tax=Xenia sp. Carnegie-2017 TaxID=2897299 RepID=UPI001F033323|nr:uncharacterized protein LOC124452010 [Xenia sp. Carnegie-2017]